METVPYVYFDPEDYAGFGRRVLATLLDLAVLALVILVYGVACEWLGLFPPGEEDLPGWFYASSGALAFLYLTALKRSRVRTPGYWATGLRVVDLRGRAPSLPLMTLRLAWWVIGPVNVLLDIFFIPSNEERQTIRDRLVGTYVVRKDARPAGPGRKVMGRQTFMGLMFLFPAVRPSVAPEE